MMVLEAKFNQNFRDKKTKDGGSACGHEAK